MPLGRDGEPFLNLISVVPIRWKEPNGEEKEYYVGFQVDVRFFSYILSLLLILVMPPLQLNEALENSSSSPELPRGTEARQTVEHNEARGPGDETWTET